MSSFKTDLRENEIGKIVFTTNPELPLPIGAHQRSMLYLGKLKIIMVDVVVMANEIGYRIRISSCDHLDDYIPTKFHISNPIQKY